MMTSQHVLEL